MLDGDTQLHSYYTQRAHARAPLNGRGGKRRPPWAGCNDGPATYYHHHPARHARCDMSSRAVARVP